MFKRTKRIGLLLAGGAFLTAITGALAFGLTSIASAQGANALGVSSERITAHMGFGFPGGSSDEDEYLADALGISVDELQEARQEASDAAIQAALDQGLITQEQADAMTLGGFFGGRGFRGGWFGPGRGALSGDLDYEASLAEALGITADELQAARQEAQAAMLEQAVADGLITQEQADLIMAQQALKAYLDQETLLAEALGITPEQLQSYRDEDLSLSEILAEVDMTAVEVRNALVNAREAAIQQAVEDGVITQDQADQILSGGFHFGGFPGFGGFGHRGGFGPGGFWAPEDSTPPATEDTGTGL